MRITARVEGKRKVGTGFIIRLTREEAFIVTAAHVVEGDERPEVSFFGRREVSVPARVLHLEGGEERGLAALLVRGTDSLPATVSAFTLAPAVLLQPLEDILAIGFPRNVGTSVSFLKGYVQTVSGRDILFHAAGLDEGSSGSPVIGREGRVVGLVMGMKGDFLGVATPSGIVDVVLKGWGIQGEQLPPPEGPRPEQREVEQARAAMQQERRGAEQAGAQAGAVPAWGAAEAKEKAGDAAFKRQEYTTAKERFREAQQEYAQAAQAARQAAAATQQRQGSGQAPEIRAMLDDYKRALETLDAQLYKKVRPGVSEAELRNLLDSFKYTQSHTLELIVESSAFAGDQGEVKGRQQGVFVSKDGQRVPYNSAVTFMVKRTPSGWFIDSVNMINK